MSISMHVYFLITNLVLFVEGGGQTGMLFLQLFNVLFWIREYPYEHFTQLSPSAP
jgi:hypothetical protein